MAFSGTLARHSTKVAHVERSTLDRIFYTGMSVALLATIFTGFAHTYYLRSYTHAPHLSLLLYVHGAMFTSWIVLFVMQTSLVAAGKRLTHRRLGTFAMAIAAGVVVLGYMAAVTAARHGYNPGPYTKDAPAFFAVTVGDMLVFSTMVVLGLYRRRDMEAHKRLMLLATIGGMLIPAISRMQAYGHPKIPLVLFVLLYLAGPLYDLWTRGRIHRVYQREGLLVCCAVPLRFIVGATETWHVIASWLI